MKNLTACSGNERMAMTSTSCLERRSIEPLLGISSLEHISRVRIDKVDSCGTVTLRHDSKLFHIGVGRHQSDEVLPPHR